MGVGDKRALSGMLLLLLLLLCLLLLLLRLHCCCCLLLLCRFCFLHLSVSARAVNIIYLPPRFSYAGLLGRSLAHILTCFPFARIVARFQAIPQP